LAELIVAIGSASFIIAKWSIYYRAVIILLKQVCQQGIIPFRYSHFWRKNDFL